MILGDGCSKENKRENIKSFDQMKYSKATYGIMDELISESYWENGSMEPLPFRFFVVEILKHNLFTVSSPNSGRILERLTPTRGTSRFLDLVSHQPMRRSYEVPPRVRACARKAAGRLVPGPCCSCTLTREVMAQADVRKRVETFQRNTNTS